MNDQDHGEIKILEYNYIKDGIYIGTNKCCVGHFDLGLQDEGIEADISLELERLDEPFGVSFFVWLPTKDKHAPTLAQLRFGALAISNLVEQKKKIYVHCQNGHGRAPTLVSAYLIKKGMSVEEAIELIKAKRPTIHLNDEQLKALKVFATSLQN
jgi:protein-tyrosine phosphatase